MIWNLSHQHDIISICHHLKLSQYCCLYIPCHVLDLHDYFMSRNLCHLIPFTCFTHRSYSSHLWQPPVCSLYVWVYFYLIMFVLIFRFHIEVKSYSICLSLSDISLSTIPSRSIHVVENVKISFFFIVNSYFMNIGSTFSLSIHLLISTYVAFISSVQFSSVAQSCPTLYDPMDCTWQASLSITSSRSLLKLLSIESGTSSNHLILCCPLPLPTSIFPSIRVFSNDSVLHIRWPKYWSFSFSISSSNEYSGLISLGWTDWISLQSKGLSRVFSSTIVQMHQFFSAQLSL